MKGDKCESSPKQKDQPQPKKKGDAGKGRKGDGQSLVSSGPPWMVLLGLVKEKRVRESFRLCGVQYYPGRDEARGHGDGRDPEERSALAPYLGATQVRI